MTTQTINKWNEIFLFGKHKNETVQHVFRTDVQYILWLHEKNIVKFSEEIIEDSRDAFDEFEDDRLHGSWGWDGFEGE